MSIRARDLSRWPLPPAPAGAGAAAAAREKVRLCAPHPHVWPVMPVHLAWLKLSTERYGFESLDETLRHLIYVANAESRPTKKLIFKTVRCLHCHVGARADQHAKVDLAASVHGFHWEWMGKVRDSCGIKSIEKVVRIICDFYQSRVHQAYYDGGGTEAASAKEREIFGRNRENDRAFLEAAKRTAAGRASPAERDASPTKDVVALVDDPAACSADDAAASIRRCQVGRNSSSYAVALEETPEETAARRAEERIVETSAEARRARALIRMTKTFLG